ncbi:AAA family ATPase, partial [Haliangium sp. UPWRP_2]
MELTCDLHIHSHYSRATSRDLDLPHLYQWAQRKGIDIVGTGDFTHPGWRDELRAQLVPSRVSGSEEPGFFELRPELREALDAEIPSRCRRPVRFVLTAEVSHIFKKDGAVRKVHNLALMPDLATADALCERLVRLGC